MREAGSNRRQYPFGGLDPHRDAVSVAQPLGDGVIHLVRAGRPEFRGERLGGILEQGEVVAAVVEEVVRLLVRQQHAPAGRQRDSTRILARDPPSAIHRQHRAGGVRAGPRERRDLLGRYFLRAEQRVGERLAQTDLELLLLAPGQSGEIDAQRVRQLDQQRSRNRALIMLDEVQIARGDAEPRRERLLRQLALHPEAPDGAADQCASHLHSLQIRCVVG